MLSKPLPLPHVDNSQSSWILNTPSKVNVVILSSTAKISEVSRRKISDWSNRKYFAASVEEFADHLGRKRCSLGCRRRISKAYRGNFGPEAAYDWSYQRNIFLTE
jgi:hypothetical protein